jgi:uncharacterized UPF0160 family protein
MGRMGQGVSGAETGHQEEYRSVFSDHTRRSSTCLIWKFFKA